MSRRARITSLAVLVLFVFTAAVIPLVNADRYDEQIQELKQQTASTESEVQDLEQEARTLEEAIDKMQRQIDSLQAQIVENQKRSEELKVSIAEAEKELEHQKDILGRNIKAMYLEGQITTLEMLATSKDLSQFVDKQQYRDVVKSKIKEQVDQITILRLELQEQKDEVEFLITEDTRLKQEISSRQTERNRLLNLNLQQQSEFNQKIQENYRMIEELRKAQEAARRSLSTGNFVAAGPVKRGDKIANVGNTGYSDGAHLHFMVYKDGTPVNPSTGGTNLINGYTWPVPSTTRITTPFGYGLDCGDPRYGGNRQTGAVAYPTCNGTYDTYTHTGIDIPPGVPSAPVVAAADGDLKVLGCVGALGYVKVIDHGNGWETYYPHLEGPCPNTFY